MLKTLLKLMDIKTLVAGISPVLLGSVFSYYRFGKFDIVYFIVLLIGVVLIQSCANMVNDLYDYERGADDQAKVEEKALVAGDVSPRSLKMIIIAYFFSDILIGIFFAIRIHPGILAVGVTGALIMYLYSAGPKPISHMPIGEFVAGSTMGFGIVTTVIFIQSSVLNIETFLVALPTSVFIGTILLTNNLSDHNEDRTAGRKTLAIVIGINKAEWLWIVACISLLAFTGLFAFMGLWPVHSLLLVLLLFPYKKLVEFRRIEKQVMNKEKMMGIIGKMGIRFHGALIFGMIVSKALEFVGW